MRNPWVVLVASLLIGSVVLIAVALLGSEVPGDLRRDGAERRSSASDVGAPSLDGAEHAAEREVAESGAGVDTDVAAAGNQSGSSDPSLARVEVALVREGTDEPVPECDVWLRPKETGEAYRGTTDADGRAVVELPAGTLWWVSGGPGEGIPQWRRELEVSLTAGAVVPLRLEVPAGDRIEGCVVDERGEPVPGAIVRAERTWPTWFEPEVREVTAGTDGAFRVGPFDGRVGLTASGPGRVSRHAVGVDFTLGPPDLVELRIVPPEDVRVRVLGPGGAVAGASVELRGTGRSEGGRWIPAPRPASGTTDASGLVVLSVVAERYEVEVTADGFRPWSGTHAPGAEDLVVRLDRGAALRGVVRSGDGTAVAGARVRLVAEGTSDVPDRWTDGDGRFSVDGLAPTEEASLEVRAPGYHPHERALRLGAGENVADVVLEACVPVTGLVLDEEGMPAVEVQVALDDDASPFDVPLVDALTDEEGRFVLSILPPGETFFVAARQHFWETPWVRSAAVEVRPGADVTLRLDSRSFRGVAFVGTVRDALSGEPVETFEVTYFLSRGGTGHRYHHGRFERAGYPAGEPIRIVVEAPDHARHVVSERAYAAGDHHLDVRLVPRREVRFRLVRPDRAPALDARLGVRDREGEWVSQRTATFSAARWLEPDGDGLVVALDVPGGPCSVVVAPYRNGPERSRAFDFTVPPDAVVEWVVDPVRWVERTIVVHGGAAAATTISAAELEERLASGTAWAIDGPVRVTARRDVSTAGEEPRWGPVVSAEGEATAVPIRLPAAPLRLDVGADGHETATIDLPRPDGAEPIRVVLKRDDGG
ncbi:MAG: carboxypeptidase regulatory-like domain-containing protein [Planctomycetota bacterium JB042]